MSQTDAHSDQIIIDKHVNVSSFQTNKESERYLSMIAHPMKTASLNTSQAPALLEDMLLRLMTYQSELRQGGNGNQVLRFRHYTKLLAGKLSDHPRFSSFLSDDQVIHNLVRIAPLHDIGNVGTPDRFLLKPGRLTQEEFDVVKTHTQLGRDLILEVERDFTQGLPLFSLLREIVYYHHERWDGSGYPEGLWTDDIPISARIVMVADVYDALVSRRVYKPAVTHTQAVDIISSESGTLFDPDVVAAFNEIHEDFYRIAETYAESEKDFVRRLEYLNLAIGVEP